SSLDGTRSPPPFAALPGKQRHTAAMYTRARNASSDRPIVSNHWNIVLPAVHANGRPIGPSLMPGAWPISITGDITGWPVTTGPIISGHAVQPRRRVTWRRSWISDTAAICLVGVTLAPPNMKLTTQEITQEVA